MYGDYRETLSASEFTLSGLLYYLCTVSELSFELTIGIPSSFRDCCIKANRCVAFGIRLRSHT